MADWNTRLVVRYIPTEGGTEIISPIDNFNPKIDTPHDLIHSIDAENVGFSSKNRTFTFDFTVKAVNSAVLRQLYSAALNQEKFNIGLGVQIPEKDDWVFDSMLFEDCVFDSVSPSDVSNDGGVPDMKFSGMCLSVTASDSGQSVVPTKDKGATGEFTL